MYGPTCSELTPSDICSLLFRHEFHFCSVADTRGYLSGEIFQKRFNSIPSTTLTLCRLRLCYMNPTLKTVIPKPILKFARHVRSRFFADYQKHHAELSFWQGRFKADKGHFQNSHYRRILLAIAGESTDEFTRGKIVADFGCGPRGSLVWATPALLRVGIDVLADRYFDEFKTDLALHDMIYLKSTEKSIPLPSHFVDIVFTLNAIDHVDHFTAMCSEILRILKPGGLFIGSFNLEEPETATEPQRLTVDLIKTYLLGPMTIETYRISEKGPKDNVYGPLLENNELVYRKGNEGILWVRASKPVAQFTP